MTKEEIILRLHDLNWLAGWPRDPSAIPDIAVEVAIAGYCSFHGIKRDEIEQHMQAPRCALPDILPMAERLQKWPINNLKYFFASYLPGLTKQEQHDAFAEAFGYWTAVANIRAVRVDSQDEANIVITAGKIDGPSGTLAWAELPNGMRRLTTKYDSSEQRWVIMEKPQGGVDFTRVAAHEIAHLAGMPHISSGNLLAPMYNVNIRRPQRGDIEEMRSRYGPPATVPPNEPPDIPGGGSMSPAFIVILKALLPVILPFIIKMIEQWLNGQAARIEQWRVGGMSTQQLIGELGQEAQADIQAIQAMPDAQFQQAIQRLTTP